MPIPRIIGSILMLIVALLGVVYIAYGEIEPCRVLAVEQSRRAESAIGLNFPEGFERWHRLATSQMSSGECMSRLLDSWGERLSGGPH